MKHEPSIVGSICFCIVCGVLIAGALNGYIAKWQLEDMRERIHTLCLIVYLDHHAETGQDMPLVCAQI